MNHIIISGLIGSGKTTITKLFKEFNYSIFSADIMVKKLIKTNTKIRSLLIKVFGRKILYKNNISFTKLRHELIKSEINKKKIENIIHPEFFRLINKNIKQKKHIKSVIELPLIETHRKLLKPYKIIFIDCTFKNRLNRAKKNKKFNDKEFNRINFLQKSRGFYINNTNYIINNNVSMKTLYRNFENFYKKNLT